MENGEQNRKVCVRRRLSVVRRPLFEEVAGCAMRAQVHIVILSGVRRSRKKSKDPCVLLDAAISNKRRTIFSTKQSKLGKTASIGSDAQAHIQMHRQRNARSFDYVRLRLTPLKMTGWFGTFFISFDLLSSTLS